MMHWSAKDGARSSPHYGGEGVSIHPSHQGVCRRHGTEEPHVTPGDLARSSTSEARTLRGDGGSFLAPSTSVIEGSFAISEVDGHLCRGCAIAAPESLASC